MKTVNISILIAIIAFGFSACRTLPGKYDDFLWRYYEDTEPNPALVKTLMTDASSRGYPNEIRRLLSGLYFRDQYRISGKDADLDSARVIFTRLLNTQREQYYGHMGLGLMYMENAIQLQQRGNEKEMQLKFDSAKQFLTAAKRINPSLSILDFYMGKNEYWRSRTDEHSNEINVDAIYYLDSAIRNRSGFYKFYLRSAEYLSNYCLVAKSNENGIRFDTLLWRHDEAVHNKDSIKIRIRKGRPDIVYLQADLNKRIPQIQDRIRYLFTECLRLIAERTRNTGTAPAAEQFFNQRRRAEIFRAMAEASMTYSCSDRISFLDSARQVYRSFKDPKYDSVERIVALKIAEIRYFDLRDLTAALKDLKAALRTRTNQNASKRESRLWVAMAWCYYHNNQGEYARAVLSERMKMDTTNRHVYWYAEAMMVKFDHNYKTSITLLKRSTEEAVKRNEPSGYMEIELAEVYRASKDFVNQKGVLVNVYYNYVNDSDPYAGEVRWTAGQMLDTYFKGWAN